MKTSNYTWEETKQQQPKWNHIYQVVYACYRLLYYSETWSHHNHRSINTHRKLTIARVAFSLSNHTVLLPKRQLILPIFICKKCSSYSRLFSWGQMSCSGRHRGTIMLIMFRRKALGKSWWHWRLVRVETLVGGHSLSNIKAPDNGCFVQTLCRKAKSSQRFADDNHVV